MRGLVLVIAIIAGGVLQVHLDVAFAVFVVLFERLPADEDLDRELSVARHCVKAELRRRHVRAVPAGLIKCAPWEVMQGVS